MGRVKVVAKGSTIWVGGRAKKDHLNCAAIRLEHCYPGMGYIESYPSQHR
jgi:hypothetical protein